MDLRGRNLPDYSHIFKFLLAGDAGVGKTALLQRYYEDTFLEAYVSTIGVDFRVRTIPVVDKHVKVRSWCVVSRRSLTRCATHIATQEAYQAICTPYYRGMHGILIIFDVANMASFSNVKNWLQEIDRHASNDVVKLLVGNGCDKPDRTVNKETAQEFADAMGMTYVETSAKNGDGVEDAFMLVARAVKSQIDAEAPRTNIFTPVLPRAPLAERLFSKDKLKELEKQKAKRKEERMNGFDEPFDSRDS